MRKPDTKLTVVAISAALIGLATTPALAGGIVPPLPLGSPPQGSSPAPLPPVSVPTVPALPPLPALPTLPTLPTLPSLPKLPAVSAPPALPKLPSAVVPRVLPPAQAPAMPAAPGVGQSGGLPFGQFQDHVPAVALQQLGLLAGGTQRLGPDMPYDQTGHNTTADGVDVALATRAYEAALQHRRAHSSSALPGLLALVLALGGGAAGVLVYRRRYPGGGSGKTAAGA